MSTFKPLASKTAQQLWPRTSAKSANRIRRPPYPGARSTPTVDGNLLYALGSDGDLVCVDDAKGKINVAKESASPISVASPAFGRTPNRRSLMATRSSSRPAAKKPPCVALNKKTAR